MDKATHHQCLICKGRELKKLLGYAAVFLVKCKSCGFVFSEKIPDAAELIHYYERYNRNKYLSPITVRRYEDLLDEFEKFRNTNKIIDVGCGSGYFLEMAKKRGWEAYGTELTDEAVKICHEKGILMQQGKLTVSDYTSSSFDIITSFEVLEHLNNPLEELNAFYAILRKGGALYVTTPNFNSISRFFLNGKWDVVEFPEHLCYYTPAVLKRLCEEHNFSLFKIETTGISITRVKRSLNKATVQGITEQSADEKLRHSFESGNFMKAVKKSANQLLTIFEIGDTIKATFIKK